MATETAPQRLRIGAGLEGRAILWRYLDAARFLDLIHNRHLFFARGDQFKDKFEGAFTPSVRRDIERSLEAGLSFDAFKRRLRERVFLHCWHESPDDSIAMWRLHGRSRNSVAVTTTVARLAATLRAARVPHRLSIRRVEYVQHWRDPRLTISPYTNVFAYKIKAYEFEKEVRVVLDRFDEPRDGPVADSGMSVPVDLDRLLRSIVVAPEAPRWFHRLVAGCLRTYGVRAPVRRSKLALDPL